MTPEERRHLLGVVVDEADLAVARRVRDVQAPPNFAPAIDWRDHNGNHVTPIKDQGGCGSCVSFCTVSTVESMASIELGKTLDLSEADLHFCSDHGANCDGWWPGRAYNNLMTRGVPDETYFPYNTAFGENGPRCLVGPDRQDRAVRITESTTLNTMVERKNWLTNVGPCCAVLIVYDDFYSYGGGIYKHVTGNYSGLHCVEVIGYSDAEQCWICKNSWGTYWGDQGFFKIAYGEAGIDSDYPFWTAKGVKLPSPLKVLQTMWIHGYSMQIEYPDRLVSAWRTGSRMEVEGKLNTDNWFHFAIPTPVLAGDEHLKVEKVKLYCETMSPKAVIRHVHIYDGSDRIAVYKNVNLSGSQGVLTYDVPEHPKVNYGIGVSIGVHFVGSGIGSRVMRFRSVGCDFGV
jgi:hypothetical protein